jgi:hypothetical protein
MMVSGYEHQTWQCTGCDDIERRLMFIGAKTPIENVPVPPAPSPDEPVTAPGAGPTAVSSVGLSAFARAVAKLRGKHTD